MRNNNKAQGVIGLDKLWSDVRDAGFKCGRNRVYRLQKENELYSVRTKPFRVCITDSDQNLPKAPALFNQNFKVDRPNQPYIELGPNHYDERKRQTVEKQSIKKL